MKIKKLHIENFGKLHELTIDFEEGLNQFCFENGYGKTTLSIFIKAMFYGMAPARENIKMERKKYMPWQGGNFGGSIEFLAEKESFRITRFFAKTPEGDTCEVLNLSTNQLVDLKGQEIGQTLFGVGKDTFEMTAFFPQLNFSVLSNQQISANILGLEKFQFDLANVNTAINQIKKKMTELKREKTTKSELDDFKKHLQEIKIEIASCENNLKQINQEISKQKDQLLVAQNDADLYKKEYEQYLKKSSSRESLEEQLIAKQSELNSLLTQLNLLTSKENENKIKENKSKKINDFLNFSMLILGVLGLVGGVIIGVLKVSVIATVCLVVVSAVLVIAGIILIIKSKKKKTPTFNDETKDLEMKILLLKQEILLFENNLSLIEMNEFDYEKLEEKNNIVYQLKLKIQSLVNEQNVLNQRIENYLEKHDNLKSEYYKKEELYTSSSKKLELLEKTKEFLAQANENVSKRFIGPANLAIKEILSKFEVRNREFIVDANFDIKEVTNAGVKEEEYSSQGYQDILAFCVRVYLLKEIYKTQKPFIILDDTFVNLDDQNMLKAKEVLKGLEKNYQIIYMCCNSRCKMK